MSAFGKMREGAASFTIAKKSGLMAANGSILVPPKYDHLSPPKDGWCIVKSKDRYLFIDTKGKVVFDPIKIGNIAWEFDEGVTPIRVQVRKARGKRKASHRWGYINKKGKMVIKPKYVRAHKFSEGLASVETDMRMGFLFGYADAKGTLVIKPQWHHTEEFSEGLAVVKVGEKFGFIDKTGKMAIEAKYDSVTGFSNGLAHVRASQLCRCPQELNRRVSARPHRSSWVHQSKGRVRLEADASTVAACRSLDVGRRRC